MHTETARKEIDSYAGRALVRIDGKLIEERTYYTVSYEVLAGERVVSRIATRTDDAAKKLFREGIERDLQRGKLRL